MLKQIIEKHREFNWATHLAFIDTETAFNRIKNKKRTMLSWPDHEFQANNGLQ